MSVKLNEIVSLANSQSVIKIGPERGIRHPHELIVSCTIEGSADNISVLQYSIIYSLARPASAHIPVLSCLAARDGESRGGGGGRGHGRAFLWCGPQGEVLLGHRLDWNISWRL